MDTIATIVALRRCTYGAETMMEPALDGNGWNEWKRHVLACLETLTEQGTRHEQAWQRDHDILLQLCSRTAAIDERLQLVEQTRRESRVTDLILAIITGVLGYLGIRFGAD